MGTKSKTTSKRKRPAGSLPRLVGARSPEYKEAWMAGAKAGNDVAFDLVFRTLENLMKTLGIKRRRPNDSSSGAAADGNVRVSDPVVVLRGGTELTPEQCKAALDEAMTIIEAVGTTEICMRYQKAHQWMNRYYPAWA